MKTMLIAVAALALAAGCAADPNAQYAKAECKVVPATTASFAGGKGRPATSLEQRQAESALASSDYRLRQLRSYPYGSNVEEALHDCNR